METSPSDLSPTHLLFALIGFGLMIVVGVFVFASTLIAPLWAVALMGTLWLGAGLWAWRTWRRSMFAPLLAALGAGVSWIVIVNVGDALLGWTA